MTSPVAAYNFDEASGDVLDVTGNGHDWALNNNAIRSSGRLSKNGVGMPVVASPSFIGTSAWTVMFNRQGLGDAVWWFRFYNTADDTGSGILFTSPNLKVRVRKSSSSIESTPVAAPVDGADHHYAATYNGSVGRLYIDGVLVGTTGTATAPLDAVNRIDMAEFTLTNAFVDNLRLYDVALTQSEIDALKNVPVEADTTNDGVLAGSFPSLSAALVGTALVSGLAGGNLPVLGGGLAGSALAGGAVGGTLPTLTGALAGSQPVTGTLGGELSTLTGSLLDFVPIEDRLRIRELLSQREVTRQYILANPTWIELIPRADVRTPSGATVNADGAPRVPQMFRLIPMSASERPSVSTSGVDSGVQRRYDYTLLGEYGAVVEPNDWWEDDNGQTWRVDSLVDGHDYSVKAMITSYGGRP